MPPPHKRWTDEDKQRLVALQSDVVIRIEDTMFGREVALKKRELEAAAGHFTWEERDAMQQKLDAMDSAKDKLAPIGDVMQASSDPLPFGPGERQGKAQAD